MQKFVEIVIPYKSHLASLIKLYTASFPSITKFSCDSITTYNSKDVLELEIDFGIHNLDYKNDYIIIDYQEVGSSVGTYYSAEKMEKLIIKTEYDNNYKEKKCNKNKKTKNKSVKIKERQWKPIQTMRNIGKH